jgi:hypothetical protein
MKFIVSAALVCLLVVAAGCSQTSSPDVQSKPATPAVGAVQVPLPADVEQPVLVVTKNATCGCCKAWVDHMRDAGFVVQVHDVEDMDPIKTRVGVPAGKGSCHTAEIGGYFIEGHVPAEDVRRLLTQKPEAKGLVLPGMPPGSPGMEMPDGSNRSYMVELVRLDGTTEPFAHHGQ